MRNLTALPVFLLIILGISQTAATQTTIDFEGLADSTLVTTQYANLGVTFSGATILTCGGGLNCPTFPPFSGRNVIFDWPASFGGVIVATFNPTITGNVHKVSGRVTGNRDVALIAYSASGTVLASTHTGGPNYSPVGSPNMLLTVESLQTPIARVLFHDSGNTYTVDDFAFEAGFRIVQPLDNEQFSLSTQSFTQTVPISFEAEPLTGSSSVQWTVKLEYMTSGDRGSFQDTRTFMTNSGVPKHSETYAGMGGKVTIQATDNSTGSTSQDITIYVIGTAIPDADVSSRLVSLYPGATPNLMTGIADRESSYKQFATRTLFGVRALWPNESYDGGSHIGLMQMPVSKQYAWDWLANTAGGVTLFGDKIGAGGRVANRIRSSHPGLGALGSVELEHMAVVLYGPHASANLSRQYYAPSLDSSGRWVWVVNTAGNPDGVAYADYVFSHRR